MTTEQMKEYLEAIMDLETNIYAQEASIPNIQSEIQKLGIQKEISRPAAPDKAQMDNEAMAVIGGTVMSWVLIWSILVIIAGIKETPFNWRIFIICSLIAVVVIVLYSIYAKKQKQEMDKSHLEKMAEFSKEIEKDQQRVQREEDGAKAMQEALHELQEEKERSSQLLTEYYDLGILYPKYRNWVAVSSFYEYLSSGRCEELGGPNGAYNVFETEVRLDRIIMKLDQILVKLDQIRANQFALYTAIEEGNQLTKTIVEDVRSIGKQIEGASGDQQAIKEKMDELVHSSQLAAYHAERTQKELSYMNWMQWYRGDYDELGILRKRPPV